MRLPLTLLVCKSSMLDEILRLFPKHDTRALEKAESSHYVCWFDSRRACLGLVSLSSASRGPELQFLQHLLMQKGFSEATLAD